MRPVLLLLILAVFALPVGAETFYKWTDEQGNVHYTDEPPTHGEYEKVRPATAPPDSEAVSAGERLEAWRTRQKEAKAREAERRAERQEKAHAEEARRENCERAREKARVLEQSTRILLPPEEEGGEPVRMPDDERLSQLEQAREAVAEFCDQ
jgi:hypothetical protein